MQKLLWIALAGGCGALARYGFHGGIERMHQSGFPWGTFCVNMAGCLLFGAFWSVAESRMNISPELRAAVLVGFMGAFTTFSTYAFETSGLLRDGQWALAAGNFAAHNIVGIAGLFLGLALGRLV